MFSKPTILFLFGASILLATGVYERYQRERETAVKHAERAVELVDLEAHAAVLEAQVKYIQSPRGIEEEIRDRFDATKEGERTVVVMDGKPATTSMASTPTPVVVEVNRGWHFFSWLFFWR